MPKPATSPDAFFLAPYMPKEAYLHPAWLGCLRWAIGEPEALEAFRAATGQHWTPAHTALGTRIDETTGADRAFFVAFAQWMNANLWGKV